MHVHASWKGLNGQYVEVRRWGELVAEVIVDGVTSDDAVLWIRSSGARRARRLRA